VVSTGNIIIRQRGNKVRLPPLVTCREPKP